MTVIEKVKRDFNALWLTKRRRTCVIVCATVVFILALLACIFIFSYVNIHSEYSKAITAAGDELYSSTYLLVEDYRKLENGGGLTQDNFAGVRERYDHMSAVNELIGKQFGEDYRIMDQTMSRNLQTAFRNYETAAESGWPTDSARDTLTGLIGKLGEILLTRFDSNAHLIID